MFPFVRLTLAPLFSLLFALLTVLALGAVNVAHAQTVPPAKPTLTASGKVAIALSWSLPTTSTAAVSWKLEVSDDGTMGWTSLIDFGTVLFTKIGSNIEDPTPDHLAELAIRSARREAGAKGDDGISYLASVIARDVATPLLPGYRDAILRKIGAQDLEEAHRLARLTASGADR